MLWLSLLFLGTEAWRETIFLIHAANLMKLERKAAAHFEAIVDAYYWLVALPPTRWTAIGRYPKVMLGEQLQLARQNNVSIK